MKEKIAILTDSSSSIYNVDHNYDNLFFIDIPCFIGDEIFNNFKENKDAVFYDALSKTTLVPKTSQPSVGEQLEIFEHIKSLGYTHILYMPISKELSGTYQNGFLAKGLSEGIEIEILDTRTSISILGSMALEAARLARAGFSINEITEKVYDLRSRSKFYGTVNDLTSLVKNGRLSNAKSIIANLLKIKPVIELQEDGKLVGIENVRTYKGAIKVIIDKVAYEINEDGGVIHLCYTNNVDDLTYVQALLKERFPNTNIEVHTLPATVVAHLGLQTIAIGYINY